jgi:hypothetical protein
LNAPTDILNNENIEFEILVERIQQTCARLDKDNQRLENLILKADQTMETAGDIKIITKRKAIEDRNDLKKTKEQLKEDYKKSEEEQEQMQK